MNEIAFVIYYSKHNKYSFNSLLGSIEISGIIDEIDIHLVKKSKDLIQKVMHILPNYKKVIIAFSFFTTQVWKIKDLIAKIKELGSSKIFIISGGPHPTGDPKDAIEMGSDIVVIGEGEETIVDILKKLTRNEDYRSVKGIAFYQNGYQHTKKRKPLDLNIFPPFPLKLGIIGPIEITRGCPYACYFCQTSHIFGTKPRHRSLESIFKIIRVMKQRNQIMLRFLTPNAFSYGSEDGKSINYEKIEMLLKGTREIIGDKGRIYFGTFPSEVRPEHVNEKTLDLVRNYTNNDNIIIGAQSGSQKILDACNRGHTVEDVINAVILSRKKKLVPNVDFIFGLPNEDEKDIEKTLDLMQDLARMGARLHTHYFMPLPQTPFASEKIIPNTDKIEKIIGSLSYKGRAYGSWQKQKKLALKISKYSEKGD